MTPAATIAAFAISGNPLEFYEHYLRLLLNPREFA